MQEPKPLKSQGPRAEYYLKNKEHIRKQQAEYRANNREKLKEIQKSYNSRNSEKRNAWARARRKKNPEKVRAMCSAYKRRVRSQMPNWADREKIKQIYLEAQLQGLTVDHVIPLNGKFVSGLHVHYNLQLLSRADNTRKSNIVLEQ